MGLKVIDKGCGEKTLPDVVKVLFQSGEYGVLGFSDVEFIASCVGYNENNVAANE